MLQRTSVTGSGVALRLVWRAHVYFRMPPEYPLGVFPTTSRGRICYNIPTYVARRVLVRFWVWYVRVTQYATCATQTPPSGSRYRAACVAWSPQHATFSGFNNDVPSVDVTCRSMFSTFSMCETPVDTLSHVVYNSLSIAKRSWHEFTGNVK